MARMRAGGTPKKIKPERVSVDDVAWFFPQWNGSRRECMGTARLLHFECEARRNGFQFIAGVDEAGRGPLAGPIVAGAVILTGPVRGMNDSKQLLETERDIMYQRLFADGHAVGVGIVEQSEIDIHGIQWANYAAMLRALEQLPRQPEFALVDGFNIPGCAIPHTRLVKGDARSLSIAAASVVAKVTRDRLMTEYDQQYPGYGFANHKGYATAEHFAAIERLGPCPIHRMSFSPFARSPETAALFGDESEEKDFSA